MILDVNYLLLIQMGQSRLQILIETFQSGILRFPVEFVPSGLGSCGVQSPSGGRRASPISTSHAETGGSWIPEGAPKGARTRISCMVSQVRTAEFDAFGPWILKVDKLDDVPRLFRPAADLEGARLAVKIPRQIERRNANPLMDLYDRLLIVRDQGMEVITRTPKVAPGWQRLWVNWGEVSVIQNSWSLLDGLLRFHRIDGAVLDIPFNAVSKDLIGELLAQVRDCCRPKSSPAANPTVWPWSLLGDDDVDLVNCANSVLRCVGDARVIHARLRQPVRRDNGPWAGVLDRLRPGCLHAAIIAATPRDLIIVNRRRTGLETARGADYSVVVTGMALAGLTVQKSDVARWQGVRRLRLAPTALDIETVDGDGVEDAIRGLLTRARH